MRTVYALVYFDGGLYRVYALEHQAKEELWRSYQEDHLAHRTPEWREQYEAIDRNTLNESGYIEDYGWIEPIYFVE